MRVRYSDPDRTGAQSVTMAAPIRPTSRLMDSAITELRYGERLWPLSRVYLIRLTLTASVTIGRLGETGVADTRVEQPSVSAAARRRGLSMAVP